MIVLKAHIPTFVLPAVQSKRERKADRKSAKLAGTGGSSAVKAEKPSQVHVLDTLLLTHMLVLQFASSGYIASIVASIDTAFALFLCPPKPVTGCNAFVCCTTCSCLPTAAK